MRAKPPAPKPYLQLKPVDVGIPPLEPQPRIQPVRRLPRRPRRQVHRPCPRLPRQLDGPPIQRRPDATPPRRFVHHHILDPRPHPARQREEHQHQHPNDLVRHLVSISPGDQHRVGRMADNPSERLSVRRRRTRQLRMQPRDRASQRIIDKLAHVDANTGSTHAAQRTSTRLAQRAGSLAAVGHLEWFERPEPSSNSVLIAAFSGWNDAGDAATESARYLRRRFRCHPVAQIDPEFFYDFASVRPSVQVVDGERQIDWPTPDIRIGEADDGRTVITLLGVEPRLRGRMRHCMHISSGSRSV